MSKSPQQRKEPLSLRVEPKIKYLIEIASRVQRRNISNYVEFTLENSLRDVEIEKNKSVLQMAEYLWSTREEERVLHLAEKYPELLTYDEQKITGLLKGMGVFFQNEKFTKSAYKFYNIIKESIDGDLGELHYVYTIDVFYNLIHNDELAIQAKYNIRKFINYMINKEKNASKFEVIAWNILRTIGVEYGGIVDAENPDNPYPALDDINNYDCEEIAHWWIDLLLAAPFPEDWIGYWAINEEFISPLFKEKVPEWKFQ